MKAAVLVVLAAAGLAALSVASCSVRRVSDGYVCDPAGDSHECQDGRSCVQGFCIEAGTTNGCPSPCTTCDTDHSCRIECTPGKPCGNVQCPAGYDCRIRCNNTGACGTVDCAQAHSCDIDCSGSASCGNINCGMHECAIDCSGAFACPEIDCAASCSCDVSCTGPAACPVPVCPMGSRGPCTQDGSAGAPCDSTEPGCDVCN
jgi:hypothetical protein